MIPKIMEFIELIHVKINWALVGPTSMTLLPLIALLD